MTMVFGDKVAPIGESKTKQGITVLAGAVMPPRPPGGDYLTRLLADALYAPYSHSHAWSAITDKPTNLAGYGIAATDVTAQLLTGMGAPTNVAVAATDSIRDAVAKLQGQLNAIPGIYQPASAELSGLAGLSSAGYVKRTGAGAYSIIASIPQADVAGLTSSLASKANTAALANYLPLAGGTMSGQLISTCNGYHPSVAAVLLQSLQPTIAFNATGNAIDSKAWLITSASYWLDNEFNILSGDDTLINYLPGISLRRAPASNSVAVRLSHVGGSIYAKPLGAGFVRSASDGLLSSAAITSGDLPATISSNTTGTAARWTTSRSISMTGDVTWSTSIDGSANATAAATIAAGAVTLAKLAAIPANTILGNNTGSTATPIALTVSQAQTLLGLPAGGWTLQSGYGASTAPQITTTLAKGALVVRNGTGTDPASVLEVQAASGSTVFQVGGTGDVMFGNRLLQAGVTERINASGDLFVAAITSSALGSGFVRSSAGGLLSSSALASGDVTTALGYTPPSGSGVAGRVAYWSSATALSSDADLTFDGLGLRVGNSSSSGAVNPWIAINQYAGTAGGGELWITAAGTASDENSGKIYLPGCRIIGTTQQLFKLQRHNAGVYTTALEFTSLSTTDLGMRFAGLVTFSTATASTMAKFDSAKGLVSATAGTDYLAPSAMSGTSGQIARFSGTNTATSDAGWRTSQTSGVTWRVMLGGASASTTSTELVLAGANASGSMADLTWSSGFYSAGNPTRRMTARWNDSGDQLEFFTSNDDGSASANRLILPRASGTAVSVWSGLNVASGNLQVAGLTASRLVMTDASKNLVSSLATDDGTTFTYSGRILSNLHRSDVAGGTAALIGKWGASNWWGFTGSSGSDRTVSLQTVNAGGTILTDEVTLAVRYFKATGAAGAGTREATIAADGTIGASKTSLLWEDNANTLTTPAGGWASILSASLGSRTIVANTWQVGMALEFEIEGIKTGTGTTALEFFIGPSGTYTTPYYIPVSQTIPSGQSRFRTKVRLVCVSTGASGSFKYSSETIWGDGTTSNVYTRSTASGYLDVINTTVDRVIDFAAQSNVGIVGIYSSCKLRYP